MYSNGLFLRHCEPVSPPVCSFSSSSLLVSELEQPLTEQELDAIDAIEATFQSSTTSFLNKKRPMNSTPDQIDVARDHRRGGRRLPNSILPPQIPPSFSLSPCRERMKIRLPVLKFGGSIIYSRTETEVDRAAKKLTKIIKKESGQVALGFDIEWKPTFKRGGSPGRAAVMQLCMDASHCHVMHIIHSGIPKSLQSLLEDSSLSKVGVGIGNDAVKIFKDYNVSVEAVEELSYLANQKLDGGPQKWSLKSLTEMLISKELPKPSGIQRGNWEADLLSKEQLQYAATDAFASWYLYEVLKRLPDAEKVGTP